MADAPSSTTETSTVATLVDRGKKVADWWKHSRPGRAMQHYGGERGTLLCGGIAFSALFSVFAALAIGYTIFANVLGSNTELQTTVLNEINSFVPGLIQTAEEPDGLLEPSQLLVAQGFSWSAIIPALVLLWTAISFMTFLRRGVRAMFGLSEIGQNFVLGKVWALVGFLGLAVGVVLSSGVSIVVSSLGTWFLDLVGVGTGHDWLLTVAGLAVSLLIDTTVVAGIVVVVAGARPSRRDLWIGALICGVAFAVLRYAGTSLVVGSATASPLLGSFVVVVTLLLLVNFISRVLLMVSAWMADPPFVEPHPDPVETPEERAERERAVREGPGTGYLWSPVVRGIRRGVRPRPRRLVERGEALRPETRPED
ncbi:hypothetical protein GCM10025865_02230 [Paraoerskovia sediminicola]|uniref:YihY/virulence factor BrkB family protein n=1 Tax=Paraoerskovia sediminicola TaxID=1138587 RepID=A0ABN6X878_9CELL|nr:YihY/virulence factor BrkB family protein [Paraoerskovia sediminicola]BDZ40924.1 hypothetical protein GCM10025865_02230 [Paraoerskovia sediminicola]